MNVRDMTAALLGLLLLTACGGSGKKTGTEAKTGDVRAPAKDEDPDPESDPSSNAKQWYAKAALTPVKGSKLKPSMVSFSQREDDDTNIEADALDGVRPGTYWLVVHDGETCGPNATKAGPPWPGASDTKLRIVIGKDMTGGLEVNVVRFALAGGVGAIGHTLVLHEDKKGKTGKALACGLIEEVDEP